METKIDYYTGEIEVAGNKFDASRTGLTVHGEPTFDEWEEYGKKLEFVEGSIQWLIGDWLVYGEFAFGEMYSQALNDTQAKTWRNYKWVANSIELSTRVDNLSWAHHREVADFEPEEQRELLALAIDNDWSQRDIAEECRKRKRAALPPQQLPEGKYHIIYADPPWQYDFSRSDSRKIENQYPTMTLDEICELEVGELAAPDCVLFLWATNPKLEEAFWVISSWGFDYKTNFVWVKDKIGMGYYARAQHELLLIATRGSLPIPEPENRFSSVVESPRTNHSSKPTEIYEIIDRMYPDHKKVELFARNKHDGWDAWGNQV